MQLVATMTPEQARAYCQRWKLVREVEIATLRSTTMETKLRQLAALMASKHLFRADPVRDQEVSEVRDRWARLRQGLGG